MKKKTWALAGATLVLAAVALGAAKVALEPGLPPTSSADVGYRATDDREVAAHADELVWVRITGSSEDAPLFGGGPVRVDYRAQVEKAFKGAPPASVTVSVVYADGDRTRMTEGRSYVIAMTHGAQEEERWMLPGSIHVRLHWTTPETPGRASTMRPCARRHRQTRELAGHRPWPGKSNADSQQTTSSTARALAVPAGGALVRVR
ncbi:hypothetical protein ABZY81_42775 [Streptomyces sp. NPDC006514]|uniref:hypothetical protein n=1 Tax=Streptomyces sp. NPDC006514 TaxID=3154308 RepID=UPI0033B81721